MIGEKRSVKSVKILPLSMESINPMQKHPHIQLMFLLLINF